MLEGLIPLGVIATTVWVGFDSSAHRVSMSSKGLYTNGTWVMWVLCCVLLWIVTFPWYLSRRSQTLRHSALDSTQGVDGDTVLCPYCAQDIRADASVCRYCGRDPSGDDASVEAESEPRVAYADGGACSECHSPLREGAKFCGECGVTLTSPPPPSVDAGAACPGCGQPAQAGDRFCRDCGYTLA